MTDLRNKEINVTSAYDHENKCFITNIYCVDTNETVAEFKTCKKNELVIHNAILSVLQDEAFPEEENE